MLILSIAKWMEAGIWGLVSGFALLIGALLAYFTHVSARMIAGIMAFGSGVLISALAFNLMNEAYEKGGFISSLTGFVSGAIVYTVGNYVISKNGGKHRKRSGNQQAEEGKKRGSGLAIALGSLMDGIPESIAIGVSMIEGGAVSMATVISIFLSNIPEGLSSSNGMKNGGRSAGYIFGLWIFLIILFGVSSWTGYTIFSNFSPTIIAATVALAAGAILAMIVDTMIPEAFEKQHNFAGLITVAGFAVAFILTKLA